MTGTTSARTLTRSQVTGSNFSYQHQSFERFLQDMVDLGLHDLELWGVAPHLHIPTVTNTRLERIARELEARELSVYCVTPEQVAYPVNIASPDEGLRESSVAMFLRAAEICSTLGAPLLFLTSGRGAEDEPRELAWRRSVDGLRRIVDRAADLGVACVLEPLQRVESNLVLTSEDAAAMLAEVDAASLGVALDTVAMTVSGETVADYFRNLPGHVNHVHLVDGSPAGHLAWGDGEIDLPQVVRDLGAHGYAGRITFEIFGDGSYAFDPRPHLQQSLNAFERAIAQ
ncbi:sugar phosphate isomerase/epimerase family protein [Herbiconiux sp. SYSU D00978]|uniref:sugar phosphate isomerase/epimerase family protein n=1 Tax=Herbiconiux sp. SYSU D00978 TaxID=2812562 RepID=UPI001A96D005|nr:sugar phosphate isomerase/epimerase family protein [Herbiconiux sp. SYSU D00978]